MGVKAQEKVAQATIKVKLAARKAEMEVELAKYAAERIAQVKAQKKEKQQQYYKQAAGGKLSKLAEANWEITVNKNVISATNKDPLANDQYLQFNKYTEAMTPSEIASARQQMASQPAGQGGSTEQCDACHLNCGT